MSIARRHHVVPASYLARFTVGGMRRSKLWSLDLEEARWVPTTPGNAAHRRDFYAVEIPEAAKDVIEKKVLAPIEGGAKRVLDEIDSSLELPTGDDMEMLMHFVALMALRVPGRRDSYTAAMRQISDLMMREVLATRERWEQTVEAMQADGIDMSKASYDEMRSFIDSGEYEIDLANEFHVGAMLSSYQGLVPVLQHRTWILGIVDNDAGELITSDDPVKLEWSDPAQHRPYPPGFGLTDTTVFFPLSRKLMLLGVLLDGRPGAKINMNRTLVAGCNLHQMVWADRWAYAAVKDFPWMAQDGLHDDPDELIELVSSRFGLSRDGT